MYSINRGYYKAARRYEISLPVLKNISRVCAIYYINSNEIPNHFTLIVFGVKGAIYYVALAKVIFSHVQITRYFHM